MRVQARVKIIFAAAALFAVLLACALFLPHTRANAAETSDDASLMLPETYEQYLDLQQPSSVAVSAAHTVIADGSKLYIYDRARNRYFEYEHHGYGTQEASDVSKVQIYTKDGKDRIFFSDGDARLFEYLGDDEKIVDNIPCPTFLIDSERGYLFTANASAETGKISINRYLLDAENIAQTNFAAKKSAEGRSSNLAIEGDKLYCSIDNGDYVVYRADTLEPYGNPNELELIRIDETKRIIGDLKGICVLGGELYYTVNGAISDPDYPNGLYKSVGELSTLLIGDDGFSALAVQKGEIYCVKGKSVRKLTVGEDGVQYGSYEIAAASNSENRLSGAVDVARAGNLIVSADAGNGRISVISFERRQNVNAVVSYQTVPCVYEEIPYTPTLVATDGNVIAVADAVGYVYLYRYGELTPYYRHSLGGTPATGLACVYGNTYFVTEHAYGKAEEGVASVERSGHGTNISLASDLYGDLYVLYNDGSVGKFSETDFLNNAVSAEKCPFTISETGKIRADFEGNVYHIQGNALYKNGTKIYTLPETAFVFGGAGDVPLSVAIGFEDDVCYFLYGNYIVQTENDAVDIPTLNEISAAGVHGSVFRVHQNGEGLLVDIPAGTIGIRTDLQTLRDEDPAFFPYISYYRTNEDLRGILLTQSESGYSLVVLYEMNADGKGRTFTTTLFRTHTPVPLEEYWTAQTDVKYLTNDVNSYYYPCLHPALGDLRIKRGTEVRIRGVLSAPERDYALVDFMTQDNTARAGFVPVAYLTIVNPYPEEAARYEYGYLKENADGLAFVSSDGDRIVVTERTLVRLVGENDDGTYAAVLTRDGKLYAATVQSGMIERGESDALRISLIVVLSVLAVIIIGVYAALVPAKYFGDRRRK